MHMWSISMSIVIPRVGADGCFQRRVMERHAAIRIWVTTEWYFESQVESASLNKAICVDNTLDTLVRSRIGLETTLQNGAIRGHSHHMWKM